MVAKSKKAVEVAENPTDSQEIALATAMSMTKRQDVVENTTNLVELAQLFNNQVVEWTDVEPSFPIFAKDTLEGVPFVIAGFRLNESTKYTEPDKENPEVQNPVQFVSLLVAAYDEENGDFITPWGIINDGGTGIREQIIRYFKRVTGENDVSSTRELFNGYAVKVPPIKISAGLRKSEYTYVEESTGKKSAAHTWYLG